MTLAVTTASVRDVWILERRCAEYVRSLFRVSQPIASETRILRAVKEQNRASHEAFDTLLEHMFSPGGLSVKPLRTRFTPTPDRTRTTVIETRLLLVSLMRKSYG